MATNIQTLEVGSSKIDPKIREIKFEGDNSVFFWRMSGDVLNPEAEIIVPETHQALYIKDGVMQEILEGGRYPIFDVKKSFFHKFKKVGPVTVDIIFFSKTCKTKVLWGTKVPLKMRDEETQIPVTVKANGEFEARISNPRKFYLELVGSDKFFSVESLKSRLSTRMLAYIEPEITRYMHNQHLSYMDLAMNKTIIADNILPQISKLMENDYGLSVTSFVIADISINEDEEKAIEAELTSRRNDVKTKLNAKEIAEQVEKLSDKKWEREKYLKELERADKDKYYEVLKLLGWPEGKPISNGGLYCPNCGHSIAPGTAFCPNCGKPLPGGKKTCPKCGHVNDSEAVFCAKCGTKL